MGQSFEYGSKFGKRIKILYILKKKIKFRKGVKILKSGQNLNIKYFKISKKKGLNF